MPRHYRVTFRDVMQAHDRALSLGGRDGVRSVALIESAIGRPYSGYYRSIANKAAALTQSLAMNHGFVDGNKRTTVMSVSLLVRRSGYELVPLQGGIDAEIEKLILSVVSDHLPIPDIVRWFQLRLRRRR